MVEADTPTFYAPCQLMHHASNSSGVVEGWAAVLLASPNYAKAHGLKPHARVVAMANMGDSPP